MSFPKYTQDLIATGIILSQPRIVTIPSGSTTSNSIDLRGSAVLKIFIPANFVGTSLTFQLSLNNVDYKPYKNANGDLVVCQALANDAIGITPIDFLGVNYLKIISNATESGADIAIITQDIR